MINIFKIRKEERWLALGVFLYTLMLNVLVIIKYYDRFSKLSKNYRSLFVKTFHISGYDPLTYEVVSKWTTSYNIHRHPLLAFFMYIPNQINQGLIMLTGHNCVQFVVAAILIFCAFYSFIFLYRIFREIIELQRFDASVMTIFTFSFAYVMVASMVPDHFVMSMFMLVMTLYISGLKMKKHLSMSRCQTILLFVLTAGISLSNGVKTYLAGVFTNGKRFFRPLNILLVVIIPSALIWMFANYEYQYFEYPKWHVRQIAKARLAEKHKKKIYQMYKDTTHINDSSEIASAVDIILKRQAVDEYRKKQASPNVAHQGEPIAKGEYINWTDISTPRMMTAVENLFGESILLHQNYLLGDTLAGRPVIVHYKWIFNYIVEGIIVLLFGLGLFLGRKNRFMWMAVSFMAFDMLLHFGLGFGINEVYIMSPHWAFVITIVIACLVKKLNERKLLAFRSMICCLAAYLLIYNTALIVEYLTIL